MKKLFFMAAVALLSLSAFAQTATIRPTWEANYRTDNN